ncbi:hypothetical protein WJX72_008919 [[Myrmecia] bisecta]|uniref:Hexosyltransferase n=1 Tax=[Myrmecia] bisecta TaxID=41462 RepID=A0AAW1Q1Z4_9CHLO
MPFPRPLALPLATAHQRGLGTQGTTMVEFATPGLFVRLIDALNIDLPLQPAELAAQNASLAPIPSVDDMKTPPSPHALQPFDDGDLPAADWPESPPVMDHIDQTAAPDARARRQAIRETWAAFTRRHFSNVDIVFILTQPAKPPAGVGVQAALQLLEAEVRLHNDTVILRGREDYLNLPNKTLRLMRFALTHPSRYTHVLKTDDDCYVRMRLVLNTLLEVPPAPEEEGKDDKLPSQLRSSWWTSLFGRSGRAAKGALAKGKPDVGAADKSMVDGRPAEKEKDPADRAKQPALLKTARMEGVYIGALEARDGFHPIRDPHSKWFTSPEELPDKDVPWGQRYLAGWGYVLSRDVVAHLVAKVDHYERQPAKQPCWFKALHWEDVLVGLLVTDYADIFSHPGFKAAWRSCTSDTAVRHLDVDAPIVLPGLYEQEKTGMWQVRTVQCSLGSFKTNEYASWHKWRSSLPGTAAI